MLQCRIRPLEQDRWKAAPASSSLAHTSDAIKRKVLASFPFLTGIGGSRCTGKTVFSNYCCDLCVQRNGQKPVEYLALDCRYYLRIELQYKLVKRRQNTDQFGELCMAGDL